LAETGKFVLYKHCKYQNIPGDFLAVGKFICDCVMGGLIQLLGTGRARDFLFTKTRRSALGLRENWVCFDRGVKRAAWDGDHSPLLNPLNAELNPICHLLVFLGDLTFMGPCIVTIF
jgi:hypothetical protein